MSDAQTPPSRFPWPPLLTLLGIAASTFAGVAYPIGWIGEPLSDILFAIGWIGVALTILFYVTTVRALSRAGTTVMPTKATTRLVTDGPFAVTRNPIYLANVIFLVALGLILGSIWFCAAAVLVGMATTWLAILPEERHLKAGFGKKYRDYATRVRRWI